MKAISGNGCGGMGTDPDEAKENGFIIASCRGAALIAVIKVLGMPRGLVYMVHINISNGMQRVGTPAHNMNGCMTKASCCLLFCWASKYIQHLNPSCKLHWLSPNRREGSDNVHSQINGWMYRHVPFIRAFAVE